MVKIDFTDEYKQLLWQIPLFRDLDVNVKHRLMDELEFTLVSTHCMALVPTSNLFYLCVELKNRQQ